MDLSLEIQSGFLRVANSLKDAFFLWHFLGREAPDNWSIVGRQSFITMIVDRLSIDTRQGDQTDFVYRLSTDLQ